jgi:hypothetical protein
VITLIDCVFAHDHQVGLAVRCLEPGHRLHRAHVREEQELLAQAHIRGGVTLPDRRRGGSLECDAARANGVHDGRGKRVTVFLEGDGADLHRHPLDLGPRCIHHAARGIDDFGTDSISRQQDDPVPAHGFLSG